MSKAKQLKRGDAWATKDRWWLVVDAKGKPLWRHVSMPAVFLTRSDALAWAEDGQRVVRLGDLSGTVA